MSAAFMQKALDYSSSGGDEDSLRALLGGLLRADWRQALAARGYCWHFDAGAFSTPIVGGGNGTVLDQDQPEFGVSVPSGYTLIPLRIHVNCQTPLIASDSDESEILIAADRAAAFAVGSGTVVTETPVNLRSSTTGGCNATCFSAGTGDITNPTLNYELAHAVRIGDVQTTPANALWGKLDLLYEPKFPPFFIGPACIYGYWGGTVATSGFAQVEFAVIASTLITELV